MFEQPNLLLTDVVDYILEERRKYIFNTQQNITHTGSAMSCLLKNALKLTSNKY
jgi:hypothetical protein